jgi:hypothetical protein
MNSSLQKWSPYQWLGLVIGFILLIPLLAMQLTDEVRWMWGDFLFMGGLLLAAGSAGIWILRRLSGQWRWPALAGLGLLFLWVWAELAVGLVFNLGS